MERIRTTRVTAHVGERVLVEGWLHSLRQLGGVNFVVVRDGWGMIQCVTERVEEIAPLNGVSVESIVRVEGMVVSEKQAPGGVELHDLRVEVLVPVTEALPVVLNKRKLTADISTILDLAMVTDRHSSRRALLRLGAGVMSGFRETLTQCGFTEIQTPKIVGAATESGANVFKLDYFGRPAYLAQSPQFYKQMMVGVFERVFEVAPVFRAEPHDTARHINESFMTQPSFSMTFGIVTISLPPL